MNNHIANNIITRGNMNISALTKGFILPYFIYEIRRKHGGGSLYGEGYDKLQKDLQKLDSKDIDAIIVKVNWNRNQSKYNKYIYAELIKNKIEVQLIENIKINYNITVELL